MDVADQHPEESSGVNISEVSPCLTETGGRRTIEYLGSSSYPAWEESSPGRFTTPSLNSPAGNASSFDDDLGQPNLECSSWNGVPTDTNSQKREGYYDVPYTNPPKCPNDQAQEHDALHQSGLHTKLGSSQKRKAPEDEVSKIKTTANKRALRCRAGAVSDNTLQDDFSGHQLKLEEDRVAARNRRTLKRDRNVKLRSDERNVQDLHDLLSRRSDELALEAYDLKMQLLKHADCGCKLIQEYIGNEAQRAVSKNDQCSNRIRQP